jgi:deoxyribose-phosphate aldolase
MPDEPVDLDRRAASLVGTDLDRGDERSLQMLAVRCTDLTSLEGTETPERIDALCDRARRPDPHDPRIPAVAAVCVYPRFVRRAVARLQGTGVAVAAVAGGFPTGLGPLDARLDEIASVVEAGATEVDIVLNRAALLDDETACADELVAARRAAGGATLKVILETGALGSCDLIHRACLLAAAAGAEFVKSSTGKVGSGVTPSAALCMMDAVGDVHAGTGRAVGIKLSGGIRSAPEALGYLAMLRATLGPAWMRPTRFRFGASSLLDEILPRLRA